MCIYVAKVKKIGCTKKKLFLVTTLENAMLHFIYVSSSLRYSKIGYQFVNSYGKKSRTHFLEHQVKNDVDCLDVTFQRNDATSINSNLFSHFEWRFMKNEHYNK